MPRGLSPLFAPRLFVDWRLACAALLALLAAGMGCKKSASAAPATVAVQGQVQLPAGFSSSVTGLTILNATASAAVNADGSFATQAPAGGVSIACLTDGAGNVILLGMFDTTAGTSVTISAATTASTLLYFYLGAFALPPENAPQALSLIAQAAPTASLAATVAAEVAANPIAITAGDAQIDAAADQAAAAIKASGSALAAPPPASRSRLRPATADSSGNTLLYLTNPGPTTPQSGVEVGPNPNGDGVVVMNLDRRPVDAYFYEVYTGSGCQSPPPPNQTCLPVSPPLAFGTKVSVPAVHKVNGALKGLFDVATGNVPYQPITSEPVVLPLDNGSMQTVYQAVVIGPVLGSPPAPPALFSDPRFSSVIPSWQQDSDDLLVPSLIFDIVVPYVVEMVAGSGAYYQSLFHNPAGMQAISAAFQTLIAQSIPDFRAGASSADYADAVYSVIKNVLTSEELREAFLKEIETNAVNLPAAVEPLGLESDKLLEKLGSANSFLRAADAVVLTVDLARSLHDLLTDAPAVGWLVTVAQPTVRVAPATATVTASQNIVPLTVSLTGLQAPIPPTIQYQWSTTGSEGHLESSSSPGVAIPSGLVTDTTVDYVTDLTKLTNGGSDTVTVQAFNTFDPTTPLGQATSTITGQTPVNGPCGNFPPSVSSTCGSISVSPSTVAPGGQLTVTVTALSCMTPQGGVGNLPTVNLDESDTIIIAGETVDGVSTPNPNNPAAGYPNVGGSQVTLTGPFPATHTVVYTIAARNTATGVNSKNSCPTVDPSCNNSPESQCLHPAAVLGTNQGNAIAPFAVYAP